MKFLLLLVLLALIGASGVVAERKVAKGVFESCPACKLNAMPELRRFFFESVKKGEYGDTLSVTFIPGAVPTLILYDADLKEISREAAPNLPFDELHAWVQAKGFTKVAAAAAWGKADTGGTATATATAAATGPAPVPAGATGAEAAAGDAGGQHVPAQRRRRRRRLIEGGGAAGGGSGGGQMRRRRRRQAGQAGPAAAGGGGGGAGGGGPRRRRRNRQQQQQQGTGASGSYL